VVVPKILLVDDHEIIREGLCALLEKQLDMEVVGAVGDGRKAVDAVLRTKPDVVPCRVSTA